jgi:hypothetical protein
MSYHPYNLRRRQHAIKPVEDPPDPLNDDEDKQPHPSESALNKWTPTLLKLSIQFVECYVLTDGYLLSRLQNIDRKKQNVTIVHTIGCTQRIKESLDMLQRATGIGAVSYNRNSPAFVKKHPDRKGFWQWRVVVAAQGRGERNRHPSLPQSQASTSRGNDPSVDRNRTTQHCHEGLPWLPQRKRTYGTLRGVSKGKDALLEVRLRTQPA